VIAGAIGFVLSVVAAPLLSGFIVGLLSPLFAFGI
jgi:hypothetical protein